MMKVAHIWLELGELKCWAQSRKDLPTEARLVVLPLLLLEPYEGAVEVKVSLVRKAWVAQKSHMICLKLWVLRSSAGGPSQTKKPKTKSQVLYVACWCQNKSICLIFFSFSTNFLDLWETTIELKPGPASDGKTGMPLPYTCWSVLQTPNVLNAPP